MPVPQVPQWTRGLPRHSIADIMRQRVLFGSLMILTLVALVVADAWLSEGPALSTQRSAFSTAVRCGLLLTLLVAALAYAAAVELGRLCEGGGFRPLIA